MGRAVAWLRGMNVGGHRITNAELVERFQAMGFGAVATYRASGNVLFDDGGADPAALREQIEQGLGEGLGSAVPTMIRSADEVRAVAAFEAFAAEHVEASKGKIQVTFFRNEPSDADRDAVLAMSTDRDRLNLQGRELFWLPSGGILDAELDYDAISKRLGLGTMRTLGTVRNVVKKL